MRWIALTTVLAAGACSLTWIARRHGISVTWHASAGRSTARSAARAALPVEMTGPYIRTLCLAIDEALGNPTFENLAKLEAARAGGN